MKTTRKPITKEGTDTGSTLGYYLLFFHTLDHLQWIIIDNLAPGRLLEDGGAAVPAAGPGQLPALLGKVLLDAALALLVAGVVAGPLAHLLLRLEGELGAGLCAGGPIRCLATGMEEACASSIHTPAVAVGGTLLARRRTLPPLVGLRQAVAAPA